jgi:Flp pilus assembly pilin Flp
MTVLYEAIVCLQVWQDNRGQDLIEYALMAALVAAMAGAIMPGAASSVNTIFSRVNSVLTLVAN